MSHYLCFGLALFSFASLFFLLSLSLRLAKIPHPLASPLFTYLKMPPKKDTSKSTTASTAASERTSRVRTSSRVASVAETKVKNETPKNTKKPAGSTKTAKTTKTTKAAVVEKPTKPRKMATSAKSTTATKKRKADEEEEKPRETKRTRVVAQPRQPRKPKSIEPKAKPAKVVINEAPTTKLNVFVCGEGSSGELGLGTAKNVIDVKRPRFNKLLSPEEVGVVQIAVGGMHCVALAHDNKIFTWGVNDQGALGRETAWDGGYRDVDADSDSDSDDDDSGLNPLESNPTAIPTEAFPEGTVFVQVAAADSASFALTDDGLVYGWGTFRVSQTARGYYGTRALTLQSRATTEFSVLTLTILFKPPRCLSRRSRKSSIWLAEPTMYWL